MSFYNQSWSWKHPEGGTLSESHTVCPAQSVKASVSSRAGKDAVPWVEHHWDHSPSSHWRLRSHVPVHVPEHWARGGQSLQFRLSRDCCLPEQYEPLVCHKLNPYNAVPLNLYLWWSCRCLESQARPTVSEMLVILRKKSLRESGFPSAGTELADSNHSALVTLCLMNSPEWVRS